MMTANRKEIINRYCFNGAGIQKYDLEYYNDIVHLAWEKHSEPN